MRAIKLVEGAIVTFDNMALSATYITMACNYTSEWIDDDDNVWWWRTISPLHGVVSQDWKFISNLRPAYTDPAVRKIMFERINNPDTRKQAIQDLLLSFYPKE